LKGITYFRGVGRGGGFSIPPHLQRTVSKIARMASWHLWYRVKHIGRTREFTPNDKSNMAQPRSRPTHDQQTVRREYAIPQQPPGPNNITACNGEEFPLTRIDWMPRAYDCVGHARQCGKEVLRMLVIGGPPCAAVAACPSASIAEAENAVLRHQLKSFKVSARMRPVQ
jgi:hypothetical protein